MEPTKLLTSAQLMRAASVGRETLRHYEEEELIMPAGRTAAGYRRYSVDVIQTLAFIKYAQSAGFTLREIRELLELRGTAYNTCGTVNVALATKRDQVNEEIRRAQLKLRIIDSMTINCCSINGCTPDK